MDEKYLQGLYDHLGGEQKFGSFNDFRDAMGSDSVYRDQFYKAFGGQERFGSFEDFDSLVKKKDGGQASSPSGSTGDTTQAPTATSVFAESGLGTREGVNKFYNPVQDLSGAEQAAFRSQGGLVASPQAQAGIIENLYTKGNGYDIIKQDLISKVDEAFQPMVKEAQYTAENLVKLGGSIYGTDEQQQQQAANIAKGVLEQKGYSDATTFVNKAIDEKNVAPLRDVLNNYYGNRITQATKAALGIRPKEVYEETDRIEGAGTISEERFYTPGLLVGSESTRLEREATRPENVEKVGQTVAPLKREKDKLNFLLDQIGAQRYAVDNPIQQQDYQVDVAGTKPIKDEITPTQYSGLRYFKDNYPELYNTYSLELSKAADPSFFGATTTNFGVTRRRTYDKNNRDYQYLLYVLDKKGVELNAMSSAQQLQQLEPAVRATDTKYKTQLNALVTQMQATTDMDEREAIRTQAQQVAAEYQTDPAMLQYNKIQSDMKNWDVDFNTKYPEYAARAREQRVRDILSSDGKGLLEKITQKDRFKWLTRNTIMTFEQMAGAIKPLEAMRVSEEEAAEMYQPTSSQAIQPLYKLNFNDADYDVIKAITDSDKPDGQKEKEIEDYLTANRDRIQYVENPAAGKRNWQPAAIGNQVADVTTQVIFQAALTYATDGLLRGKIPFGSIMGKAAGTAAVAEGAVAAEAAAGSLAATGGAETAAGAAAMDFTRSAEVIAGNAAGGNASLIPGQLKDKLYHFGSVVGTTYAVVYQQAYTSALFAGKSQDEAESYANQIALVNGLSEVINPDVNVLKNAARGVRGLSTAITPANLTTGAALRRAGNSFVKGYARNVVPETIEEVAAAYGEYGVDALHNMNQDEMNNLNNRVEQAITSTVIGMAPFGAWSGFKTIRNSSKLTREQYYQAGLRPEIMTAEINTLRDNGNITEEDANQRVQLVNTMAKIVQSMPTKANGSQMSDDAKQRYALNKLQQTYLTAERDQSPNQDQQAQLDSQIVDLQAENETIIRAQNETIADEERLMNQEIINPAPQPAGPRYSPGTVLEARDGDRVTVVSHNNGLYGIQFPNGDIEDFTEKEIGQIIDPREVIVPADRQVQQSETAPQSPAAVSPVSEVISSPVPTEATPEIISPINRLENATEEIIQPQSIQPERAGGNESGQAPETGGSDRLLSTAESEGTAQGEETVVPEPVIEAPVEQPPVESPAESTAAEQVDENAHLTIEQQREIPALGKQQLYDRILEMEPTSAVRGRLNEMSQPELEVQYKAALASQNEPRAEAVEGTESKTDKQLAIEQLRIAREAFRASSSDLNTEKPGTPGWDAAMQRSDKANRDLKAAEDRYLQTLSEDTTRLLRKKRGRLYSTPIPTGEDARVIANYIEMIRIYGRRGVRSLTGFAKQIGEHINDYMRRAWEITSGLQLPVREDTETNKDYLARLRAFENVEIPEGSDGDKQLNNREKVEENRLGIARLADGIDLIRNDNTLSRENYNAQLGLKPDNYISYVAALKWNIEYAPDNKRELNRQLRQLRQNDPKKVIAAEMKVVSLQMRAMEAAARVRVREANKISTEEGIKLGKQLATERIEQIRDQIRTIFDQVQQSGVIQSGEFSGNDVLQMGRMIATVSTDGQISRLNNLLQRMITDTGILNVVQTVEKLQNRLRSISVAEGAVPANLRKKYPGLGDRSLISSLTQLDPSKISNPVQLNAILDNLVGALTGRVEKIPATATEAERQEVTRLNYSTDQIRSFINSQQQDMTADAATDVLDKLNDTVNYVTQNFPESDVEAVLNPAAITGMVNTIRNNTDLNELQKQQQLQTLENAIDNYQQQIEDGTPPDELSIPEIYQGIQTGAPRSPSVKSYEALTESIHSDQWLMQQMVKDGDVAGMGLSPRDQQLFSDISQVDTISFTGKELNQFKNVIDNILVNRNFSGAEYFQRAYYAQEAMRGIKTFADAQTAKLDNKAFDSWLGKAAREISTKDQIVRVIANNFPEFAGKLTTASSLGDIKAANTKTQVQLERDLIAPLRELRKRYRKMDVNSAPSTMKRGLYAYLNQYKIGSNLAQQQNEFDRRKAIVEQDYTIKQASEDEYDRMEGELEQQIYEQYFKGMESSQDMAAQKSTILNEGERAIYDLFQKYYQDNVGKYAELSERLLNRPFQEWTNYTKDSFKRLTTGLAETGYTKMGFPAFTSTRDPMDPANSMIERGNYNNLDQIVARNEQGEIEYRRVLNFDFDSQQMNSARDMTSDLYSLPDRVQAHFAMKDATLKSVIGVDNARLMAENINDQVKSNLRQHVATENTPAEKWVYRIAEISNKIGVRLALASITQLPKQVVDIVSNTAVMMAGPNMLDVARAWIKYPPSLKPNPVMDRIFEQADIGLRGKSHGATSWLVPPAIDQIKNTIKEMGQQADMKEADRYAWLIEAPDTWAAKAAWITYYAESLKSQGLVKKFKDIDWQKEGTNINREARDYADNRTSTRLNLNSRESASRFYEKARAFQRALSIIFLPFSSFSMNNWALMYGDIKTLYGDGTFKENLKDWKVGKALFGDKSVFQDKRKQEALRSIASRIVAEYAFQAVRAYTSLLIARTADAALNAITGIPPEEENNDQFMWKLHSEVIRNMAFSMLGNISDHFATNIINSFADKTLGTQVLYSRATNPNDPPGNLGMFTIGFNSVDKFKYYREMLSSTDSQGNPVDVTTAEKMVMGADWIAQALAWTGKAPADVKNVLDRMARRIDQSKDYKDARYIKVGGADQKPRLRIGGLDLEWTDEQLEYYREQHRYHLQQNEDRKDLSEDQKKRNATERSKADLIKKFGRKNLNLKKKK